METTSSMQADSAWKSIDELATETHQGYCFTMWRADEAEGYPGFGPTIDYIDFFNGPKIMHCREQYDITHRISHYMPIKMPEPPK